MEFADLVSTLMLMTTAEPQGLIIEGLTVRLTLT